MALTAERIRHIRVDNLKLTQEQAGLLLGGGKRNFHKYETGQVSPSKSMENLLLLLENDPELMKQLEFIQEREKIYEES